MCINSVFQCDICGNIDQNGVANNFWTRRIHSGPVCHVSKFSYIRASMYQLLIQHMAGCHDQQLWHRRERKCHGKPEKLHCRPNKEPLSRCSLWNVSKFNLEDKNSLFSNFCPNLSFLFWTQSKPKIILRISFCQWTPIMLENSSIAHTTGLSTTASAEQF